MTSRAAHKSYLDALALKGIISLLSCFSVAYSVGVEQCCVARSCLKQTGFQALVDSGSSFTYVPTEVYEKIVFEVLLLYLFFLLMWNMNFILKVPKL